MYTHNSITSTKTNNVCVKTFPNMSSIEHMTKYCNRQSDETPAKNSNLHTFDEYTLLLLILLLCDDDLKVSNAVMMILVMLLF